MTDCVFCDRIAAREYGAFTDDPDVVWFAPLDPVVPGHMLFVPVWHVEDALADPYTTAITMEIASRWWGRNWGALAGEPSCNLITSAGANATQTVTPSAYPRRAPARRRWARAAMEQAVSSWMGWRVETWWMLEKASGRLWHRLAGDRVTYWLDWLPSFTYRHRKEAERRRYKRIHGVPL